MRVMTDVSAERHWTVVNLSTIARTFPALQYMVSRTSSTTPP